MFSRVLIATDLSDASFALIHRLASLRSCGTFRCLLLLCLSSQEGASLALTYSTDALEERLRRQKKILEGHGFAVETRIETGTPKREINRIDRERLAGLAARLASKGDADVEFDIRYGSPYTEIMKSAEEDKTDLIVLGSQGRGFIAGLFLGGLSHNLARNARCSLLVIPMPRPCGAL